MYTAVRSTHWRNFESKWQLKMEITKLWCIFFFTFSYFFSIGCSFAILKQWKQTIGTQTVPKKSERTCNICTLFDSFLRSTKKIPWWESNNKLCCLLLQLRLLIDASRTLLVIGWPILIAQHLNGCLIPLTAIHVETIKRLTVEWAARTELGDEINKRVEYYSWALQWW